MTARLPPELRAIRGTSRRDRDAPQPPASLLPRVSSPPAPPSFLTNQEAIAEWNRSSAALAACGLLREGSLAALAHYCHLHGALVDAYARGSTPPAAYYTALRNFAASLGLVLPPTSRLSDPAKSANRFAKYKRLPAPLTGA